MRCTVILITNNFFVFIATLMQIAMCAQLGYGLFIVLNVFQFDKPIPEISVLSFVMAYYSTVFEWHKAKAREWTRVARKIHNEELDKA